MVVGVPKGIHLNPKIVIRNRFLRLNMNICDLLRGINGLVLEVQKCCRTHIYVGGMY